MRDGAGCLRGGWKEMLQDFDQGGGQTSRLYQTSQAALYLTGF